MYDFIPAYFCLLPSSPCQNYTDQSLFTTHRPSRRKECFISIYKTFCGLWCDLVCCGVLGQQTEAQQTIPQSWWCCGGEAGLLRDSVGQTDASETRRHPGQHLPPPPSAPCLTQEHTVQKTQTTHLQSRAPQKVFPAFTSTCFSVDWLFFKLLNLHYVQPGLESIYAVCSEMQFCRTQW